MSDPTTPDRPKSPVSRRAFLRTAGVAGGAAALGPAVLRGRAEAQETPSPVRPDPAAKRGGTLRYAVHNAPAHFDVHQSGTVANIGPAEPDVRHPAPPQPEGRADDHSRPGAEVGDLAGRQAVHVPPPQGREVPRRRRLHRRGRQGHLRAHRAAAQGRGHPAHAALRDGGRDRGARSPQDRVPAHRGAAQGLHAGRLRERLEHHRAEEDPRRQRRQPAPGDELPGHRALPPRLPARTRRSGSRSATPTTGTRGCRSSTSSRSTTSCRSRRSWAPRSSPAASTTRACSTRSPGARPRRCRA